MNKNTNIEKINKISKLCRIFSKIIMIFCIVGAVLIAATGIIAMVSPEHISMITDASSVSEISMKELILEFVSLTVSAVFGSFAVRLSKALETCETPFTEEIIKKMKQFGIAYICCAVASGLSGEIISGSVSSVLVILLLVNVFAYGAELQKESDELL